MKHVLWRIIQALTLLQYRSSTFLEGADLHSPRHTPRISTLNTKRLLLASLRIRVSFPHRGKLLLRLQIVAMQLLVVIRFRVFGSISPLATSLIWTPKLRSYSQHSITLIFSAIVSLR